jgi:hypothetical protein
LSFIKRSSGNPHASVTPPAQHDNGKSPQNCLEAHHENVALVVIDDASRGLPPGMAGPVTMLYPSVLAVFALAMSFRVGSAFMVAR